MFSSPAFKPCEGKGEDRGPDKR